MTAHNLSRRELLGGGLALAAAAFLPARPARGAAGDLDFASALDAARAIRTGQVSSAELTTRMLARIGQYNPKLNAIVTLTPGDAPIGSGETPPDPIPSDTPEPASLLLAGIGLPLVVLLRRRLKKGAQENNVA